MGKQRFTSFSGILLSLTVLIFAMVPVRSEVLHTTSRWIVDANGTRVKLACVNWPAHLEPMVAEGLSEQPLDAISKQIGSMGFNCVRLTWATYLITDKSLASLTVAESFSRLGLTAAIAGFQANNPTLLNRSLIYVFQAVVWSLGNNSLGVILDNHVSKPSWCCSIDDGNGFFGDTFFKVDEWLTGLSRMAWMFKATPAVVGMSLRNELRGSKQNKDEWYRYMQKAAERVHSANKNVLIILSGLSYDTNLTFLLERPARLSFSGKLVFELHWYGFHNTKAWQSGNPNKVCGDLTRSVMSNAGFLVAKGMPLFVSEFGGDLSGANDNDNKFLSCFFGFAAELDLDWAWWTVAGKYLIREGVVGVDEAYGLLIPNFSGIRNSSFLLRISALQLAFQGPNPSKKVTTNKLIFHPETGLCVLRKSNESGLLRLGHCADSGPWSRTAQMNLKIEGEKVCLQAVGVGKPAGIGPNCDNTASRWAPTSASPMHLFSGLGNDTRLCLDVDSNKTLITDACRCLNATEVNCSPTSQWFKIIDITRTLRVAH